MADSKSKLGFWGVTLVMVGTVIGSGIFFKADNILSATQGSIALGALCWALFGVIIYFAANSLAQFAMRTNETAGVTSYMKLAYGNKVAYIFGFFWTFIYFPVYIGFIPTVAGDYFGQILMATGATEVGPYFKYAFAAVFLALEFVCVMLSQTLPARLASGATIIKLIPLFVVGILGLILTDAAAAESAMYGADALAAAGTEPATFEGSASVFMMMLAALPPIAFAFDGWANVTTLTGEIKDPEKTLPKAFAMGIVLILVVYLLYFVGVSLMVTPEVVVALGNSYAGVAGQVVFGGAYGIVILNTFICISVAGTAMGFLIAGSRAPLGLSKQGSFKDNGFFAKVNKAGVPANATIVVVALSYAVLAFSLMCEYFMQQVNAGAEVGTFGTYFAKWAPMIDSVPIVTFYLFLCLLFVYLIKNHKDWGLGFFKGVFSPCMAIFGSVILLFGSFIAIDTTDFTMAFDPVQISFPIICILLTLIGLKWYKEA